jgi:putative transposase
MNFHRYYLPGSTVFITQVVQNRLSLFEDPENLTLLCTTLHSVQEPHPFFMVGYVFLPDHFHMMITPSGDSNFTMIMHSLKTNFTKNYKKFFRIASSSPAKIWQKRFWDHIIRNDKDMETHLHYIHFNPIKHGLVLEPEQWKNSSFEEWERRGFYPVRMAWQEPADNQFGE